MLTPDIIRPAIIQTHNGTIVTIEVSAGCKIERFPSGYNIWRQAVEIQVKAHAIEGKANKAIVYLIADTLQVPKTSVQIVGGQTSSHKRVFIEALNPESVITLLASRIPG
jgi:hypothetical protein